jgi:hypothetical protein
LQAPDQIGAHPAQPDHAELHWPIACHGQSP